MLYLDNKLVLNIDVSYDDFILIVRGIKPVLYKSPANWSQSHLYAKSKINRHYDYIKISSSYKCDSHYIIIKYRGYKVSKHSYSVMYPNRYRVDVEVGDFIIKLGSILDAGNILNI